MTLPEIDTIAVRPDARTRIWAALQLAVHRLPNAIFAWLGIAAFVIVMGLVVTRSIEVYALCIVLLTIGMLVMFFPMPRYETLATPNWYLAIEAIVGTGVAAALREELARRHSNGHALTKLDVLGALAHLRRAEIEAGAVRVAMLTARSVGQG